MSAHNEADKLKKGPAWGVDVDGATYTLTREDFLSGFVTSSNTAGAVTITIPAKLFAANERAKCTFMTISAGTGTDAMTLAAADLIDGASTHATCDAPLDAVEIGWTGSTYGVTSSAIS